jgi:hypothetical protein
LLCILTRHRTCLKTQEPIRHTSWKYLPW